MTEPLHLFILAGEPSGDRLGADLVARLRQRSELALSGVGGDELDAAGLRSLFPMRELAVMGWADVLPRLPLLLWRVRQVADAIRQARPDVAVLVDSQVFSMLVARRLRRLGYRRPVLLYVAPAVWAWKAERARAIAPLFDEVLAVLPFEPQAMAALGGPPTSYVGHPAAARIAPRAVQPKRGPLLLLPGSREGELRRHLPLMREIAARFADHPAVDGLILPTLEAVRARVESAVADWPQPVAVVADAAAKAEAFDRAVAAVAVTGTVTLELALAGVPMVASYVADAGQARFYRKYRPKFAALPNILLDRALVPEILDVKPDPERVGAALSVLLDGGIGAQLEGFATIRTLLEEGQPGTGVADPAERVLHHAGAQRAAAGT
jgi:lipid-A-disaccharide synthase